jgi:hypothetical protein
MYGGLQRPRYACVVALYFNIPVGLRSLRIKRYGTFDGKSIPPDTGWRFVDELGFEVPPGFFPESETSFTSVATYPANVTDVVANYEGTFELRKAQIRWGRTSGEAVGADDAVTTHHFIKLVAGAPSAAWVAADFVAAEARLATFWNAIKLYWLPGTSYKQVRWYKAGPGISPPQAPVRIIDPAVPGTGTVTTALPPQTALSITEKTTSAKNWGRFYLPAPGTSALASINGRLNGTLGTIIADAADVLYEGLITDGMPAVVYSSAKASRTTAGGGTLAASDAIARGVTSIQVDDLFDVIRSRRWNTPLLRTQRDIAGA